MPKWIFVFLLVLVAKGYSQKQNNIWVFGNRSGINFNNQQAAPYNSSALTRLFPYYTTSICNKQGNLLFYTDGDTVWNRQHIMLDVPKPFWPWKEYTIPLLMPYVNADSLFYLFGVSNLLHSFGYVTVNLKANGGMGQIVTSTVGTRYYYTELLANCSLVMAATNHCNQTDKWVVGHKQNSLMAYRVSATGVDKNAVVTTISNELIAPGNFEIGNIKFSANGEKLVVPLKDKNQIIVFDFDNYTGWFSNPVKLDIQLPFTFTEADISPDGGKLYYDAFDIDDRTGLELHSIFQMDLQKPGKLAIEQSRVNLSPSPNRSGCSPRRCWWVYRSMQLGPDGRMYISVNDIMSFTDVIEEPNEAGTAATYNVDNLNLKKVYNTINYNYNRSESYTPAQNGIQVKKANCTASPVQFSLLYSNVDSVKWNFGDADAGSQNYSFSKSPFHTYPAPGVYPVKAIIYHHCFTDTANTSVTITQNKVVKIPATITDTVLCNGGELLVNATTPFALGYVWSDAVFTPTRTIIQPGTYEVRVQNECSVDVRKFTVTTQQCACDVFIPTAFTPNNDGLNDTFHPMFNCNPKNYSFKIYSRLGNIIFSSSQVNNGWDGYMNSKQAGSGIYVWAMEYIHPNTGKVIIDRGTITLIR